MKTLPIVLAILAASAAPAFAESSAVATDEITFSYDLDTQALTSEVDAAAVYRDLQKSARAACTLPGVRGFDAVDNVCVADLVEKVVALSGSALLESGSFDVASR